MRFLFGILLTLVLAALPFTTHPVAAQSVNNFIISSFDIQYDVSKDTTGHSVLKTVETITAEFTNAGQNHGIERDLYTTYDGHPVHLNVTSVVDENNVPVNYSTTQNNDTEQLFIGDPDTYVQGTKTYIISYTQHDVTRFFSDTDRDEWYWDTNGTFWKVPISQLTVSMTIDPSVAPSQTGEPVCYKGLQGDTTRCGITATGAGEYTLQANSLNLGENVTVAFGFNKGTFAVYQPTFAERFFNIWTIAIAATTVIAIVLLIILIIAYYRRRGRSKEVYSIAAEYIPPKGVSVLVSSQIVACNTTVAFSAQLIDFAVRHFIQIIETKPKSVFRTAQYDIKIVSDPAQLHPEEQEILNDMFNASPVVGDRLALSTLRNNSKYYLRTRDNDKKMKLLVEGEYGLREKSKPVSRYFYRWSLGLLITGVLTLSPALLLLALIAALMGTSIRPLTDKGLELKKYLLGLEKYIKAAEVERLKFLQGPDTVQKIGESIDTDNPDQLLKLYERVLPYAILFGQEDEWSKRLGEFYANTQSNPGWYNSPTAFNAALFSANLNSFSLAAASSGGSSSSTSGGSSGGGFSGGGGGGGGGGGW